MLVGWVSGVCLAASEACCAWLCVGWVGSVLVSFVAVGRGVLGVAMCEVVE